MRKSKKALNVSQKDGSSSDHASLEQDDLGLPASKTVRQISVIHKPPSLWNFLVGGKLFYNIVLVSAIQQELAITIHISPPS